MFFTSIYKARITELENAVQSLRGSLADLEDYIHSDAFHDLLDARISGIIDESKFDDLAQEAVERCVSNAELKVRF